MSSDVDTTKLGHEWMTSRGNSTGEADSLMRKGNEARDCRGLCKTATKPPFVIPIQSLNFVDN